MTLTKKRTGFIFKKSSLWISFIDWGNSSTSFFFWIVYYVCFLFTSLFCFLFTVNAGSSAVHFPPAKSVSPPSLCTVTNAVSFASQTENSFPVSPYRYMYAFLNSPYFTEKSIINHHIMVLTNQRNVKIKWINSNPLLKSVLAGHNTSL